MRDRLAWKMRKNKGCILNGFKLKSTGETRNKTKWEITKVDEDETSESENDKNSDGNEEKNDEDYVPF